MVTTLQATAATFLARDPTLQATAGTLLATAAKL
jgi:hypothetical protein